MTRVQCLIRFAAGVFGAAGISANSGDYFFTAADFVPANDEASNTLQRLDALLQVWNGIV